MKPAESAIYREAIELRNNLYIYNHYEDDIGIGVLPASPLPPGNYTIEGLHTTAGEGLRQKGAAAFKIELQIAY